MPSAPQPSPAIELQPHIAAIDMRQANLRLGGDSALFVSLLTRLDQQFADTVSLIRAELASGQGDAAARRLHSLRGAAGNVAATEVATLASEAAIRDGRTDDMTGQLDRLDRALGALLQSIRQSCAVAVEAEVITPVAALNRDEAAALVASLEARSLDAIDVFQRLRPALTQSYGRECIGALAHEVDDLAFDRAAERLRDLLG